MEEWGPAMTTWSGGGEPKGKRGESMWGNRESKGGEEGQAAPFIVGQVYGAGHTWLLPGKCGWSLDRIPTEGMWFAERTDMGYE